MKNPQPLVVTNVSKSFAQTKAIRRISLTIKPKEIYALIGPNGSGKTTLLKSIVGLHSISKGSVRIFGHDIETKPLVAKQKFGYVPDNPSGFEYLTGQELLNLTASLKNIERVSLEMSPFPELIKAFELTHLLNSRIENYSRGSRQKLSFIAALIGLPQLLIIDEPIVGLDPQSITYFGKALRDFANQGGSVLLSTHILDFGQQFATKVGVLHNGKLVTEKSVRDRTSLNRIYQKITKT